MGFARFFSETQLKKMTVGENAALFGLLKADVLAGEVFPAVRKDELHFYYRGGCLYRFAKGAFRRDKNFEKFGIGLEALSPYERAKRENERKFTRVSGKVAERQLLDGLNRYTFDDDYTGECVVLDVEIDLNAAPGHGKKCDMALFNRRTNEIMFVEGKVYSDPRVLVKSPSVPEVIGQVNAYTAYIEAGQQKILEGYATHIEIIDRLFERKFCPPQRVIQPGKLLVYATPQAPTQNGRCAIEKINAALGRSNVLWVTGAASPSPDEIWSALKGDGTR